jgi:ElaB/YqjD/DUF883 family membrane-anchored ribosome-binding protein
LENRMETVATSGLGNAEGALNKAASGAHSVVDSIAGAAHEAARKTNTAAEQAAAVAHRAVDMTVGAGAQAGDWLAEKGEGLSGAQKKIFAETRNYVSAHPLKALGMAAGVGFLLTRLFLR